MHYWLTQSGKEKVDSDISECLAHKTKQDNIYSKSTSPQETNLVVAKHGKCKKLARLGFSGAKGVVHLSSDSMDLKLYSRTRFI